VNAGQKEPAAGGVRCQLGAREGNSCHKRAGARRPMIEAKRGGGSTNQRGRIGFGSAALGWWRWRSTWFGQYDAMGSFGLPGSHTMAGFEPGRHQFGRLHALRGTRTARGRRSPGIAEREQGIACQPLAPDKCASCSSEYPGLTGTDIDPRHQDGLGVPWPHPGQDHRRGRVVRGRACRRRPGRCINMGRLLPGPWSPAAAASRRGCPRPSRRRGRWRAGRRRGGRGPPGRAGGSPGPGR
jgi:hypothetical protein